MVIRRPTLMLILLVVVIGMVVGGELWLEMTKRPVLALIYWGLCILLAIAVILLGLGEMRYLRMQYPYRKRQLLKEALNDAEFKRKLEKKKRKLVIEEQNQRLDEEE